MRICVIGSGYVGLVTAAIFADMGNNVICVDIDQKKIDSLNNNVMPIYEPGLEEMVARNMKEGRVQFSSDVRDGIRQAEIVFICVGTPAGPKGETDLSYVRSAATTIGEELNDYKIIINKSTVPVGTGDLVRAVITENQKDDTISFDVVSNPEFLREGQAIADARNPDRVVIGAPNKNVAGKLVRLYGNLDSAKILVTDVPSAELIKYASNTFLALKISFINSVADLCEATGANVEDVADGMGLDHRIGRQFLNAGIGYGGSCFPKDVLSLLHTSREQGVDFGIIEELVKVNERRAPRFVQRIKERFPDMTSRTFGLMGLAFKPDTDDIREAKSVELVTLLTDAGATVKGYDPVATETARAVMPNLTFCRSPYELAEGVDALILVTEWREFRSLDLNRLQELMKTPVIFDGRNLYTPSRKRDRGFEYHSIGRP